MRRAVTAFVWVRVALDVVGRLLTPEPAVPAANTTVFRIDERAFARAVCRSSR